MLKLSKELFYLLTPSQRRRFYILQMLVIATALAEIVGIASMAPFMALVGDVSVLDEGGYLADLYVFSGLADPYDFVFWVGVGVLISLSCSAVLSILTTWRLAMFAANVGTENADRLYSYYMNQPWLFHAGGSSAQLVKQVANEAVRVTDLVILPLMQINAKAVLAIFLSAAIFLYKPLVSISGLLIFCVAYTFMYLLVRKRLQNNGQTLSDVATQRFRLMNEGFGGIKDVLLLDRNQDLIHRFAKSGKEFAYARGNNHVLWLAPRYVMELVGFGAIIGLVLYLIVSHEGNLGEVLPVIAVYALAGFKLMPAFQHIYSSIGQIRGNIAAFEAIRDDLRSSQSVDDTLGKGVDCSQERERLSPRKSISLRDVYFTYPGKKTSVLSGMNMEIPTGNVVGIVGPSGSGKSTAIDLLLGLIAPTKGELMIDGTPITAFNRRAWQNVIGFVPQSIFLSEGSISENVAFGLPASEINLEQVKKAIKLSHLEELVASLEHGLETKVGERGVQLSGGQRQRIGIARALYHEADVIVFDEATSALDGITEKMIMEAIYEFKGEKTVIMIAHRLKTVRNCDQIFFLEQGNVTDEGSYEYLIDNNRDFERMANHA